MREPSHSLFKGAGLDRPVLTGLTQTTTRERYILSTSSLLGLVPQETTFGLSSVDSYSAHPLVNLEKNLFHIIGGTLDE